MEGQTNILYAAESQEITKYKRDIFNTLKYRLSRWNTPRRKKRTVATCIRKMRLCLQRTLRKFASKTTSLNPYHLMQPRIIFRFAIALNDTKNLLRKTCKQNVNAETFKCYWFSSPQFPSPPHTPKKKTFKSILLLKQPLNNQ